MKRSLLALAPVVLLAACAGYTRSAVRVASLDHACDQERITIIEHQGTTIVLDVCGRRRVYRDTAGANNPATWTDVTSTTEDCGGPRPEPEATDDAAEDAAVIPAPVDVDAGVGNPWTTDAGDATIQDADVDAGVENPWVDGAVADAAVDADAGESDAGVADAGARPRGRRTR